MIGERVLGGTIPKSVLAHPTREAGSDLSAHVGPVSPALTECGDGAKQSVQSLSRDAMPLKATRRRTWREVPFLLTERLPMRNAPQVSIEVIEVTY
jgi:hypothetical protein